MDKYIHFLVILFLCFVALAMSSIGIQFYDKCKSLHDDDNMRNNLIFLIATLVVSVIVGGVVTYRTFRNNV